MRQHPRQVENYTNAFLTVSGLIPFMAFWTLAATKGILWVMIVAAMIDGGIRMHAARLSTRRAG